MNNPKALLDQHANTIIEKLIERAIAGDMNAIRLCMERLLPRAKPNNAIIFKLPNEQINSGEGMLQITHSITQAVSNGEMTIEEAEKFSQFLRRQRGCMSEAERKKREEAWDTAV
jgi:hypothetical protein